jgi:hypothetical protein
MDYSKRIIDTVIAKLGRSLSFEENTFLLKKIRSLDTTIFTEHDVNVAIDTIAGVMLDNLRKVYSTDLGQFDMQTYQSKVIGKAEAATVLKAAKTDTVDSLLSSPLVLQNIFNPAATKRTNYLLLDSRYRNRLDNRSDLQWNINSIGTNYDPNTTAVSSNEIHDIVKIKIFPFKFPGNSYVHSSDNISIELVELNNQSFMAPANNKRLHFMMEAATGNNSQYTLNDIGQNPTEFSFQKPITELNTLTLRFGNPFLPIILDPDQLTATLTASGANTLITFNTVHNCNVNDYITVLNFATSSSLNSTIVSNMLNPYGLLVTAVTSNTITVGINLSSLVGTIVGTSNVYLNSKRMIIRLELTYLERVYGREK